MTRLSPDVNVIVLGPADVPVTVKVLDAADDDHESDDGVMVSPPTLDVIVTVSVVEDVGVTVKLDEAAPIDPLAGPLTL